MRTMRSICTLLLLAAGGCATASAPSGSAPAMSSSTPRQQILFETTMGKIVIELFHDEAPISSENILSYVDTGFYDGIIFHRVIPGFMIQGGGFTAELTKKEPGPTIENEASNGLKNLRGTLSMARTAVVDSATSQFFISVADNKSLDQRDRSQRGFGYAVFGRVVEGMDVVDAIVAVPRCPDAGAQICTQQLPPGMADVPVEAVVITRASRVESEL